MGCFSSKPDDANAIRRRPASIGEVAVFVPGLRVPEPLELPPLPLADGLLPRRLATSRDRIAAMAAREALAVTRPRRRAATQHGGSTSADLVQALEEYLPIVLGMSKYGTELEDKIQFAWMNQEDDAEETALSSTWYEVLSVLHMMAMLRLSQANSLLLPKTSLEGYHAKVSEENKRASVEIFLKAAGHLECGIQHVLPRMSPENRKGLPVDLSEGVLRATCMQALGQAIDVQLGLAIDSPKATLCLTAGAKSTGSSSSGSTWKQKSPAMWGSMKYLHDKIHKDTSCKVRINKDLYSDVDRTTARETVAPALPDFAVALKPEEYRLPRADAASAND